MKYTKVLRCLNSFPYYDIIRGKYRAYLRIPVAILQLYLNLFV